MFHVKHFRLSFALSRYRTRPLTTMIALDDAKAKSLQPD
jgi:hypothetical protein